MKVAILGGGLTGLTAAYYLAKKSFKVTIFEKEDFLGGMASGFKEKNWQWYLEKTVHHLFANDFDFLGFAKEIGFNKIFFKVPETASLYKNPKSEIRNPKQIPNSNGKNSKQKSLNNLNLENSNLFRIPNLGFRVFPLDTLLDLLKFPLLSFPQKFRVGSILAFFKFSPFFSFYEKQTSEEFLKKTMGDKAWNILWQPLFRKKFGKYAENILASFIWARIKKRTKKLGYIEGGFQNFIDFLEEKNRKIGVRILKDSEVKMIKKINNMLQIYFSNRPSMRVLKEPYDTIISSLPTSVLVRIGEKLFPQNYLSQLKKNKYLHAVSVILETNEPVIEKTYWLNIAEKEIPIMGIFQQTNFIDKKYYAGKHLCYLGWYVEEKDKLWSMDKKEILNFVRPYLKKLNQNYELQITNYYLFKIPFAQPIFDKEFLKNKPDFKTPIENFYLANLDMTYPFDRGTNYAVKLGKEVVELIQELD